MTELQPLQALDAARFETRSILKKLIVVCFCLPIPDTIAADVSNHLEIP